MEMSAGPNKYPIPARYLTFLAVQDSSITDIVCPLVGLSEPTNNQSLGRLKE